MKNSVDDNLHNKLASSPSVCPYIGMKDDADTYFSYPSLGNHCYHAIPDQSIRITYQRKFCLSATYINCHVFDVPWKGPLPGEIGSETTPKTKKVDLYRVSLLTLIFIVLFFGSYIFFFSNSHPGAPNRVAIIPSSPTEEISRIEKTGLIPTTVNSNQRTENPTTYQIDFQDSPSETPTPSSTLIIPSPSLTLPHTSTPTKIIPTPGPAMETPFGPDLKFLLHVVKEAESLGKIAETYNTSPDVIRAINNLIEGANLWVETVLVILPGQKEITGLPKFRVILVDKPKKVVDFSKEYSIDIGKLIFYNALGADETLPAGRWLIIPVQ